MGFTRARSAGVLCGCFGPEIPSLGWVASAGQDLAVLSCGSSKGGGCCTFVGSRRNLSQAD